MNLDRIKWLVFFPVIGLFWASCQTPSVPMDLTEANVIPLPTSVEATGSSFELMAESHIVISDGSLQSTAEILQGILKPSTGYSLEVVTGIPSDGDIYLVLEQGDAEAYTISINEDQVAIKGDAPGIFWGVQTMRQLLPPQIEARTVQPGPWRIATGTITDKPTYTYRGSMLDVARHFFGVDDVKRYIDLISMYKLNYLHLGLSNDQGWRIEIKSWPRLATHGGSTEVGGGEGGYYTQEDYVELVDYAADRFVTMVPEIDMPGHTNAALASYAELNCDGKARDLYTGIEVGFSTLCTDKEVTYRFVDDVIRELSLITPGPYIHIGGDESHATPIDKYIPFVNRVQQIVTSYNKKVLGWDEIANADLVKDAVVQYWDRADNALKGVEQGAKVLMSPASRTYLDMQYDSTSPLGLHWAGYIEVDTSYIWDPASMVEALDQDDILGIETPLWTETIETMDDIEYMVFPRMPGIAEIGWTPSDQRDWEEYKVRLGKQKERFQIMEINFYESATVPWEGIEKVKG